MRIYRILIVALLAVATLTLFSCREKKTTKLQQMDIMKNDQKQLLPLEGAYNVRDLGGYQTKDGKRVKWHKVIRSGDLNHLTEKDLDYLANLGIVSYIDFRDTSEIKSTPDKFPVTLKNYFEMSVSPGNMNSLEEDLENMDLNAYMIELNRLLVRDFQYVYADFFRVLMDEKNIPLLFHCTAGKDRTGFGAALFLSSLGVDRETIMQDYLLSAEYVSEKYASIVERHPHFAPALTVKPEYLQGAFDVIDQEFGGMENYLINHLGVDLEVMKEVYTE